jgi:hypothetical protein
MSLTFIKLIDPGPLNVIGTPSCMFSRIKALYVGELNCGVLSLTSFTVIVTNVVAVILLSS